MLVDDLRVGLSFSDVLPTTNANPIRLNLQRLGGKAVLIWTNSAFALQTAPAVAGAYTNVPGASSPYTNAFTNAARFFRLKQ
jgi:hypothetical protein